MTSTWSDLQHAWHHTHYTTTMRLSCVPDHDLRPSQASPTKARPTQARPCVVCVCLCVLCVCLNTEHLNPKPSLNPLKNCLVQDDHCFTRFSPFFFATLCHAVGPDGWWERSLRGPRPKSEVWPRAQQSRQSGSPQSVHGPTPPFLRQVSKPPEKVVAGRFDSARQTSLGPFELLRQERVVASSS